MNESKMAYYKGIELKSKRLQRNSAKNGLYSQVPDWENSKFMYKNMVTLAMERKHCR